MRSSFGSVEVRAREKVDVSPAREMRVTTNAPRTQQLSAPPMKYFMYSDTASKPSSPNFVHRQFALKKTSDISGRVSVHSVAFVEEAEAGRIKAATVRSSAPVLDPKPAKQSKGGGRTMPVT